MSGAEPGVDGCDHALVRILRPDGEPAGMGFLAGEGAILTCAHVVEVALGLPVDATPPATATVLCDFPRLPGTPRLAAPVGLWRPGQAADVAGLRLSGPAPEGARPARLVAQDEVWGHRCRVFGVPSRHPDGVWSSGELLAPQASGWIQVDSDRVGGFGIERGFSGAPVWDETSRAVVGMVVATEAETRLRVGYAIPTGTLLSCWPQLRRIPATACPYPGLAAFREQDTELFFGRTELADQLTGLVARSRFVTVVGRSGSGKSSLMAAGLVPRARRRGWAVAAFRPVPDVPAAMTLAGALLPLLRPGLDRVEALSARAGLAEAIAGGRLPEVVGEVLAETGASLLLVCVDQFEEFVVRSEPAARDLADLLVELATGAPAAYVVLTLRAETLDLAVNRLDLGEVSRNSVFLLTPMRSGQLRSAIAAPLEPTGVVFEAGLVERILDAAEDAPEALALVQFTLLRLWEEQTGGLLTHAAYDEFGGIGGAIASYAERVWAEDLDDADRGRARRLLVQLVRPGPGADLLRRTARADDLEPDLPPVARRLAATRLVVTGTDAAGATTYDLAHAALARHWSRLRDWLAEERDFRAWQEDLRESIRRNEPLRGARLTQAIRWLSGHPNDITAGERAFIAASRRQHRWRVGAWRGGLAAITALLVLAGTVAVVLQRRTDSLERQLRANAANVLVARSREHARADPDLALLLAVAAYRTSPEPAALVNLGDEYLRYRSTTRLLGAEVGEISDVEVSVDGRIVAALGARGRIALWGRLDPATVPRYLGRRLVSMALSPDGRQVAGADVSGRVEVWRPDNSGVVLQAAGPVPVDGGLRFDPSGRRLAGRTSDGLMVWDIGQRQAVTVPAGLAEEFEGFIEFWFGTDDDSIVVESDEALTLWRLSTGQATKVSPVDSKGFAAVSRDGRTAITCADRTQIRWSLGPIRERDRHQPISGRCSRWPMAPGGNVAMVGTRPESPQFGGGDHPPGSVLSLLDLGTGLTARTIAPVGAYPTAPDAVASTVAGTRLVVPTGSAVAVLDVAPADFTPLARALDNDRLRPVFSPDRTLSAGVSPSGEPWQLRLWDVPTGRELARTVDAGPTGPGQVLGFLDGRRTLLMLDRGWENLVLREVPALRIAARLSLPTAPGVTRTTSASLGAPFNSFCATDTGTPGVIAAYYAGLVTRFDVRSGRQVGDPMRPWRTEEQLRRLASTQHCSMRPGGNEIALDVRGTVQTWDLDHGNLVRTLERPGLPAIADLRFSSDGLLLAVLDVEGSMQVWDIEGNTPVTPPQRLSEPDALAGIVGFPAPDRVVVHVNSRTVVWDLKRGTSVAAFNLDGSRAGLSPDGTTLHTDHGGPSSRIPLDPASWVQQLCRVVGRDVTGAERAALPPGTTTGAICARD